MLLAILVAMNYLSRDDHGDYVIRNGAPGLLDYSDDAFDKARTQVLNFYKKHDSVAFKKLEML